MTTQADADAANNAAANINALRLMLIGLADATPERDNAMAEVITSLLAAGPGVTGHTLGAVLAYAVTGLTENHGSRDNATTTLLALLAENVGSPLLCPMDHTPCPNANQCVTTSQCHPTRHNTSEDA